MIRCRGAGILTLFLLGWMTYAFALFNVGRFSITLLLVASFALAVFGLRSGRFLSFSVVCLLASGLLAWAVAFLSYPELEKTFTHLFQYLLAIGVLIGAQSIDWDDAFPRFRKAMFWLAAITLAYGIYQFVARKSGLPFAFLPMTNIQMGSDDGFQRGASNVFRGAGFFTRVSSFFPEPSDLGRFMLWVFAVGHACVKGRLRLALMIVGIGGILISQSMGGIVGLLFLVVVFTFLKRDFRRAFLFLFVGLLMLAALFRFFPLAFETLRTRTDLIVTERLERLLQRGRFADLGDNLRLSMDAPVLGHGLASSMKVAPNNIIGSAWMLLLLERGILGTVLFVTPFFWAFLRLGLSSGTSNETRDTALMLLIVEIYCFSTFGLVFFPPTYLALGFALSSSASRPSRKERSDS